MATLLEEALRAENASPEVARHFSSLYQQESSSGLNTTTSNRGAVGGAQILPATFNSVADPGWNINDPLQNLRAGIRYDKQAFEAAKGDPSLASIFYYGGPGGMAKAVRGIAVSDPKNPNAPNTFKYAQQVTARTGQQTPTTAADNTNQQTAQTNDWQNMLKQAQSSGPTSQSPEDKLMNMWEQRAQKMDEKSATNTIAPPATGVPQTDTGAGMKERTFTQKAGRIGLVTAGAIGGEALGGPVVAAAGAAAGSYIASKTFDPMPDAERAAFWDGIFGGGGSLVGKLIGKALAPSVVRAGGPELLAITKQAGVPMVTAQYFSGKGVEMLHNIGASSFAGADGLTAAMNVARTATRQSAQKFAEDLTQNLAAAGAKMGQAEAQAYLAGVKVNLGTTVSELQTFALRYPGNESAQLLRTQVLQGNVGNIPFAVPEAVAKTNVYLAQGVPNVKPTVMGAQEIRSRLLQIARESTDPQEARAASAVAETVGNSMNRAISQYPAIQTLWKAGREQYTLGSQGAEITKILNKSLISGGAEGEINGIKLLNNLKPNAINNLTTKLEPAQLANLQNLGKALQASEGPANKALTFISNGVQVSAVLKLAKIVGSVETLGAAGAAGSAAIGSVPAAIGAAALALTPSMTGKIMASQGMFKMMLVLTKLPAQSQAAASVTAQLLAQMTREGVITPDTTEGK